MSRYLTPRTVCVVVKIWIMGVTVFTSHYSAGGLMMTR